MRIRRPGRVWLRELFSWWVVLTLLALALIPSVPLPELVLAVTGGLAAAAAAPAARSAERDRFRGRTAWLRWLLPLPLSIARDTGQLAVLLGRRLRGEDVHGRLRTVHLERVRPESLAVTHEAVVTTLLTASPGTLVVDVDQQRNDVLTLHDLGGTHQLDRAVTA